MKPPFAHAYTDPRTLPWQPVDWPPSAYRNRRVLVVGSGNSAAEIAAELTGVAAAVREAKIQNGEVDSVYLVYNEFKSVMSQRIVVERLLPIPRLEASAGGGGSVDCCALRRCARGARSPRKVWRSGPVAG